MPDPPSRLAAFFAELKRRRVFRVTAVYAGVAFVIFQIIDSTFVLFDIPDWVGRFLVIALVLGLPIVIALTWVFDITEKGVVRTAAKRPEEAKVPRRLLISNRALVIVVIVAVGVAIWSWLREPSPGIGVISSIAVLPLENQMGDPAEDYFVEGMHDAIITELSRISALKVISRNSAMYFKDKDILTPEIAQQLNVDAVVEGSVFKAEGQVRITAQLIDGRTDKHLWANDYSRTLTDIIALQKSIASAIAKEIKVTLTPAEEAYLASAPQVNPEAYNLYLKGWHFRTLESTESMPKAVEYLERAVALDSTFARAWASLGHSYLLMQWQGDWSGDYAMNRMKQALDKALELDPNLPEAHAGLGLYQELAQYDISRAEVSFRRALELDPDNTYARYEYSRFLHRTGRPDEAMAELRRAQELDPLNPQPLQGIAWVYGYTRQYDKALEYWQAVLELSPDNQFANEFLIIVNLEILMQQERYAEVVTEAEKAGNWSRQMRAEWALGNREKVYAVRDSLKSTGDLQQWEQENPFSFARFYGIMGDKEKALSLLERAYEDTTIDMEGLVYYPEFDFLRAEPRFKAVLKKIGLPEVFDQNGQLIQPLDESLEAYNVRE